MVSREDETRAIIRVVLVDKGLCLLDDVIYNSDVVHVFLCDAQSLAASKRQDGGRPWNGGDMRAR